MSIPKLEAVIRELHEKNDIKSIEKKRQACMKLLDSYCLLKRATEKHISACKYAVSVLVLIPGKKNADEIGMWLKMKGLAVVSGIARQLPDNTNDLPHAKAVLGH